MAVGMNKAIQWVMAAIQLASATPTETLVSKENDEI